MGNSIKKYSKHKGYESISRQMLQCNEMSLEARGLLAYMESMPEDYVFHKTHLQKIFVKNKRSSIDRIWNELLDMDYLIAFRKRDGNKYVYEYYFTQEQFDKEDIENLERELFATGYELAPRTGKKETDSCEITTKGCCCDKQNWGVEIQQSNLDSSNSATIKSTINKSIIKTESKDTNRYESDCEFSTSQIYSFGQFSFLNQETVQLLSHFGENAKELINKIFESKKKVEKEYDEVLNKRYPSSSGSAKLTGELWAKEIVREVKKFIYRYKTGNNEGKPIQDIKSYFYNMMLTFWKYAFILEMNVSLDYLEEQLQEQDGVLKHHFPNRLSKKELKDELQATIEKVLTEKS